MIPRLPLPRLPFPLPAAPLAGDPPTVAPAPPPSTASTLPFGPVARVWAVLTPHAPEELVGPVLHALRHGPPTARLAVLGLLMHPAAAPLTQRAMPELQRLQLDGTPAERDEAARCLAGLHSPSSPAPLRALLLGEPAWRPPTPSPPAQWEPSAPPLPRAAERRTLAAESLWSWLAARPATEPRPHSARAGAVRGWLWGATAAGIAIYLMF